MMRHISRRLAAMLLALAVLASMTTFAEEVILEDVSLDSEEVIASEYNAGDAPLYTIARITYKPNIIASLLRTYNYCTPLGLPFDTSEEIEEYAKRVEDLPDSELSPIEKALDILIEDIKNDEVAEAAEIKAHCPLYSRPQPQVGIYYSLSPAPDSYEQPVEDQGLSCI